MSYCPIHIFPVRTHWQSCQGYWFQTIIIICAKQRLPCPSPLLEWFCSKPHAQDMLFRTSILDDERMRVLRHSIVFKPGLFKRTQSYKTKYLELKDYYYYYHWSLFFKKKIQWNSIIERGLGYFDNACTMVSLSYVM